MTDGQSGEEGLGEPGNIVTVLQMGDSAQGHVKDRLSSDLVEGEEVYRDCRYVYDVCDVSDIL